MKDLYVRDEDDAAQFKQDHNVLLEQAVDKLKELSKTIKNFDVGSEDQKMEWAQLMRINFKIINYDLTRGTVVGPTKPTDVTGETHVLNLDLLRFHPVLKLLSFQGLQDFLYYTNLLVLPRNRSLFK